MTVNVALHEGRRTLRQAEQTAGSALTHMIHVEGLAVTEAIDWVGDPTLTVREVSRLRTLAGNSPELTSGRPQ